MLQHLGHVRHNGRSGLWPGRETLGKTDSQIDREALMSARETQSRETLTRGVVYIHSAPSALCPHIEWALIGVLDAALDFDWVGQPAEAGTYRTEMSWQAPVGTAATIASSLRGWDRLRFEVTEEPTTSSEGARFSYTQDLGI
jgi:hypothetical protein